MKKKTEFISSTLWTELISYLVEAGAVKTSSNREFSVYNAVII